MENSIKSFLKEYFENLPKNNSVDKGSLLDWFKGLQKLETSTNLITQLIVKNIRILYQEQLKVKIS
jgi:hypothetical protein